ncbi:MAG: T9SS type A sorting domain-containing protein [Phaeodactylibacter sp.]|nr:T9SS type A sorting domain-containing protein [Phaeodactylibacter sp.]MCB9048504.1 T9SS type A sorting domain-containing protein [Lewinellaceae bacterium]
MEKKILSVLFFLGLVLTAFSQTEDFVCKEFSNLVAQEQHAHQALLNFRSSPFTDNYDIRYQRLEWDVDPNVYYIKGRITTYFAPTKENFEQLNFDLSNALQVNSIEYHGNALEGHIQVDNRLAIPLPQVIPLGQLDSITVDYEGAPPPTGFGSFIKSSHGGQPIIWTLSEPYGALDWWPCKQDLNDKIGSVDIYVRTPAQYRVASNGVLVREYSDGDDKVYHWQHNYPIPAYLVAIAVTNYAYYSDFVPVDGGEPIEVLNYVFPENLSGWQNATGATVEVMQLYNELFGLYPFADEKYGHAQFGWGGGMEHQTMSFMGGYSHSLQAHELAHQWFGDKVTCGSWGDIWLNEGFATYLEGMTYEHNLGPNTWQAWLQGKINDITSQPNGSVYVSDTTSVNRIFNGRLSYSKGAILLHMLRWKLGDEDFFQGIRNYLEDPNLAFGYARTADLQRHLEQQSGQSLTEFLDDWYYGEGYPSYRFNWWQEGTTVYATLDQVTSHSSVDFFEMPVPINFRGAGGNETTIVFDHTENGQFYQFELPFEAGLVRIDPEYWLLSRGNFVTNNEITSVYSPLFEQVKLFPNPVREQLRLQLPQGLLPAQCLTFNANGQLVQQFYLRSETEEVEASQLSAGQYFLQLQTKEGTMTTTFLKE